MFSLIISIIGISLVVSLAGASIYYGGDAWNSGSLKAKASKYISQGEQISAALTLARTDGTMTLSQGYFVSTLVDGGYLRSAPALELTWGMSGASWSGTPGGNMFQARVGHDDTLCSELNARAAATGAPYYCNEGGAGLGGHAFVYTWR